MLETGLAALVGLGLAAACGFRVFVPLLVASLAIRAGWVEPDPGMLWLGSTAALISFAVATGVEIAGFYLPWFDNLLDSVASPAALVAGTVLGAAFMIDVDPDLRWSLAAVAGGGAAGIVQAMTVTTRAASSAGTGGLANPLFATLEAALSTLLSVLAVLLPLLAAALVVAVLVWAVRKILSWLRRPRDPGAPANATP